MPDVDGFELLARYRDQESLVNFPIIVLSATEDSRVKKRCFLQGANDYVVKLPDHIELLARIRYHSAAYQIQCERGEAFQLLKVSEQKLAQANEQLQKLNAIDPLTGIGNRRRIDEAMAIVWARSLRHHRSLAVLICDIDFFKHYNDHFGHLKGDFCIQRTAAVLREQLRRPADVVARFGGEEFVVILPETGLEGALLVAEACRSNMARLAIPAHINVCRGWSRCPSGCAQLFRQNTAQSPCC